MKYINNKIIKNQENLHLCEDFLDDLSYDSPMYDENEPSDDSLDSDSIFQQADVKRYETCGLDLTMYKEQIQKWLTDSHFFKSVGTEADRQRVSNNYWRTYFPAAIINDNGTIDVYGPLYISGIKELPEYIYFNKIYTCSNNEVRGNFSVRNCGFEKLPDGFPEEVEGNYSLFHLPNLKSLQNVASYIDGTLEIVMCDNISDFTNGIKKLGKSVLYIGKDDISTNDILNASYFKPNKKIDQLVKEAIIYKNKNTLNEAFDSDILKRLFSIPENKPVVKKLKDMPILWSALPDFSIFPCYGLDKVLSEHKKRADIESYGISILCDKNDVIKFIISGTDRSKAWTSESKLIYADDDALGKIIDNNKALKNFNSKTISQDEKDAYEKKLKAANIDYTNLDYDYDLCYKYHSYDLESDFDIAMLKYVPNCCVKCYICKSSSSKLGNYDFSYRGDEKKKVKIQNDRLLSVFGMYVANTKNYDKSPLYKKYARMLIDDNIYKNINLTRFTKGTLIKLAENVKDCITQGAEKVRRKLISFYNNNTISGDLLDIIYQKFRECRPDDVIKKCDDAIAELQEEKDNIKIADNTINDIFDIRRKYGEIDDDEKSDIVRLKRTYGDSAALGTYNRINFLHDSFLTIRRLALFLSALESYEYGDYESFSEQRLYALFRDQAL